MDEDIEQWFERRRARTCGHKRRYDSEQEALQSAYLIRLQGGERLEVYRCLFCQRFHLGHAQKS